MCGIAGVLTLGEAPSPEVLTRMAQRLSHRGPDGEGIRTFREGALSCALVHRRLAILDLSDSGLQPMAGPSGKAWIVFNGEIYNYVELREELRTLGHSFRTGTDTEVVLAAWEQWKDGMLSRFNGMFAFALWDERRQELFLARDRFGEKPLFFRLTDGVFAFASEMKAFAPLEGTLLPKPELDLDWVYRFLRFDHSEHGDASMVSGIVRLPPGFSMTLRAEGGRLTATRAQWYSLPKPEPGPAIQDAPQVFRALFDDAVRIRMRSDVPVGTSLSGGLDSSAVVATVASLSPDSVRRAFTCRMEDPRLDEGSFAKIVADAARASLHEVCPSAADFERDFDRFVEAQEEPVPVASPYAGFRVCGLAREHGTVVLLDGQGADEILGGYAWYPGVNAAEHVSRLRFLAAWRTLRSAPSNLRRRAFGSTLSTLFRAGAPTMLQSLFFRMRPRSAAVSAPLVSEDARSRHGVPKTVFDAPRGRGWLDAALRHGLTAGPLQKLLRYEDRNSMAHGREVRLPYLDHRLVELALRLPDEWKISHGFTKRVLREAMTGRLPEEIRLRRDKVARETSDTLWFTGPLRGWFLERATAAQSGFAGLCDAARYREAVAAVDPANPARHGAVAALFPWVMADACARRLKRD